MMCDKIKKLFVRYFMRELDDDEIIAVDEHIKVCPKCRRLFIITKYTMKGV